MRTRRLFAAVVGSAMAVSLAGAAFAFADTTYLNQTGTAIDATTYDKQDCDHTPLPGPGEVAWHFVFTENQDGISGHFAFSDGGQDLVSSDQGNVQAWWIITDASVTLDGSATYTDGSGGNFNLSHTCVGESTSTTPPVVTPSPTLPPTSTIDQAPSAPAGTNLGLVLGAILLVAGGLTAFAMRPRRSQG